MSIFVTKSSMPDFEEYCEEIRELWDSRIITNMGVKHMQFEQELGAYLGVPNVSLFSNGHLALENIIEAMDFPQGAEVITTPFTFASTTHAIVRKGLTPVMCDIKPDDYTLDASKIEALITEKTAAIIPVHVYGNICDIEAIQKVADKYSLKVIYDAAHAFGVKYKGQGIGNFGDASMFSFHATKVFHTIEGGAVSFKDDSLKLKLKEIKNFGIHGAESVEYVGGNAKLNEFQAAMGICNLRHIDDEINKRKALYERYTERLSGVEGIRLCPVNSDVQPNYAYMPVVFDGCRFSRDEVFEKLAENDIRARKYFYPLTSDYAAYRGRFNSDDTPVAKRISENVITLPIYADLPLEEVERICETIV